MSDNIMRARRRIWLPIIIVAAGALGRQCAVAAKEYVLLGSFGNMLYLVDPIARRVTRTYQIPGPGPAPTEIVPSPDGRVAYALTNQWQSVSGIDLDTGKQVFRADLSTGNVRAHSMYGMDVSPNGEWLYVVEQRYQAFSDYYKVLAPSIAVYRTNGGLAAKPERLISTERQIQQLAVSLDGKTLYAQGIDLYAIDIASGQTRKTYPIANWDYPGYGPADSIAFLGEELNSSGIYAMPFYAERRTVGPSTDVVKDRRPMPKEILGILTVNLKSATVFLHIIGSGAEAPGVYSASVNPAHPNEVVALGQDLARIELPTKRARGRVVARAPTSGIRFYVDAISSDGRRVYTAGGDCQMGIYRTSDLTLIGLVELPHCATMGETSLRLIDRP